MIASKFPMSAVRSDISGSNVKCLLRCRFHPRRRLRLEHRQHLPGEEPQPALANVIGRAAEAEGDIELEITEEFLALFEPSQDLVGRAPARGLHEAVDRAFEPALAGDFGFLLVGVVAL